MRILFVIVLMCGITAGLSGENVSESMMMKIWNGNNQMNIPFVASGKAPTLDGVIHEDEWAISQKSAGFVKADGNLVVGQRGFVYFCRDEQYLYIAVKTTAPNNDPGGGLSANAMEHDSAVFNDDSVEIIINPDRDANTVYQIIVNSNGVIFDQKGTIEPKAYDIKWNIQGMKVGSRAESGWWHLELALPLSEFGNPEKFLKLNICRNWSGIGASALNATSMHVDQAKMLNIYWSNPVATIHQDALGDFEDGTWRIKLKAVNPTNRKCVMAVMLRHYLFPQGDGKVVQKNMIDAIREIEVPANGNAELELAADFNDNKQRWLTTILYYADTKQVLYARLQHGKKDIASGRHPASAVFDIGNLGSGVCWYYPGYNQAAFKLNLRPAFTPGKVFIFMDGQTPIEAKREQNGYRALVPVGKTPGSYTVNVKLVDASGEISEFKSLCKLEKRAFAWENNRHGMGKIILPPFKPLQVENNTVRNLMNAYRVNPFGLWDSLMAKGEELLAEPMRLVLVENGKTATWTTGTVGKPEIEANGYAAIIKTEAGTDSGIRLQGNLIFEYDGFAWIRLVLDGVAGRTIDRLRLEIPLKDADVPLFHAVSNTIRSNPSGKIPAGEGIVWDGTRLVRDFPFGKENMHPQLVPYIWLGGIERGICWFVDSSFGYKLDRRQSALRLTRRNGVLLLEVDIINRPAELKNGAFFEFGMQPTPVKPVDPELQRITQDMRGKGVKGMTNLMSVSCHILGYPYNWSCVPYQEDFELFRRVLDVVTKGTHPVSAELIRPWMERYAKTLQEQMKKIPNAGTYPDEYWKIRENFWILTLQYPERRASLPTKYSDPRLGYIMDDVTAYFMAEWWNPSPQNYFGALRTYPVPSNMDYMMHGYYLELANGMHGVYLDDVFLMPEPNPVTVGRIDTEGEPHSEIGILKLRELVKRISVVQHQLNRYPRILQVHMTNALLVPCFSLATSQLGFESNFGESPFPERYTLDDIQATGLGTQIGAEAVALGGILRKTTAPKEWGKTNLLLSRSNLALTLLHGIKIQARVAPDDIDRRIVFDTYQRMSDFGFWEKDSRFVPYWEKNAALSVSEPGVYLSSYRRPGKTLVILSNLTRNAVTANMKIDYAGLALQPDAPVIDLENGTSLNPDTISLAGYDFKLLQIGK